MDFLNFIGRCISSSFQVASGAFGYIELATALSAGLLLWLKKKIPKNWEAFLLKASLGIFAASFLISVLFVAPYEEYRNTYITSEIATRQLENLKTELETSKKEVRQKSLDINLNETDQEARKQLLVTRDQLTKAEESLEILKQKDSERQRELDMARLANDPKQEKLVSASATVAIIVDSDKVMSGGVNIGSGAALAFLRHKELFANGWDILLAVSTINHRGKNIEPGKIKYQFICDQLEEASESICDNRFTRHYGNSSGVCKRANRRWSLN